MTPAEKLAVIMAMRAEGRTAKEIARAINVAETRIHQICAGLQIKKLLKRDVAPRPSGGVGFAAEGARQHPDSTPAASGSDTGQLP